MTHIRCPVCRNRDGTTADGVVVRKYMPEVESGKVKGRLKPLYNDQLQCAYCGTVLLVRRRGEWVQAHRVK